MSNTYFRFKKFMINQDRCAMKVCTDSCLFGAWVASHCKGLTRVLDIGAGTGLLMLMIAQQSEARIDGVEIESACYEQLCKNLSESEWHARLQAIHGDIRQFESMTSFDMIVSNPPFFHNDLPSSARTEQVAKHSSDLRFDELFNAAKKTINSDGTFFLLVPAHRESETETIAEQAGFYLREKVIVHQTEVHKPFRVMYSFGLTPITDSASSRIIIRRAATYSEEFTRLLEPYYLDL